MKGVNIKKIAALAAGAAMLGASVAVADVVYGNTQLVDQNGQPVVKVVVGSAAQASDGVVAANIAAKIANEAYKTSTLTARLSGEPTCTVGGADGSSTGTCAVTDKSVTLLVTVPGVVAGAHEFKLVINDYIDKNLQNRYNADSSDIYNYSNSDVGDLANPFANGLGSAFSGITGIGADIYKISGGSFTPLATETLTDSDSGNTYKEEQSFWVRGNARNVEGSIKEVRGFVTTMAYSAKFTNDEYGIPVCTSITNTNTDYTDCDSASKTDRHRVPIKFMGENWIISGLTAPTGYLTTTTNITRGGKVLLAKESAYAVINVGDELDGGDIKIKLSDISVAVGSENDHPAIIDILDANDQVLKQVQITPVSSSNSGTYAYSRGGKTYKIHVYQTSPGFTLNAKWAEVALYAEELTLNDASQIDTTDNINYYALLKWKNKQAAANTTTTNLNMTVPDSLREIVLYRTMFSSYTNGLAPGDNIVFLAKPAIFQLKYSGLDLTDADYDQLQIQSYLDTSAAWASCTDSVTTYYLNRYMLLTSGGGANFQVGGYSSDQVYFSGNLTNTTGAYNTTAILIPNTQKNCLYNYTVANNTVKYIPAGTLGSTARGGVINFLAMGTTGVANGTPFFNNSDGSAVVIDIVEDAGYNQSTPITDVFRFNTSMSSAKFVFKTASATSSYVGYLGTAGGPDAQSQTTFSYAKEATFTSERGSKFTSLATDSASILTAKNLAHPTFVLQTQGTEDANAQEITLKEGDEKSVSGGVKIKAKSIDETVGSCTASATGAAACTVDTTGVTAVVGDAASVDASIPYKLTSKLVVLDSEAAGVGAAVTVGGPIVNTVTKGVLPDLGADSVVVKAIGDKIVVAGASAQDTITAGDQFIAAIRRA